MSYARMGIAAIVIFVLGISAYFFYNLLETNNGIETAVEYFEDGEYRDAVLELNHYRSEMTSAQYQLYLAYISRGRNELMDSSILLAKAEEISDPKKKPEVLMEIYLNQALNAFIANDGQGIEEALEKAKHLKKVNQEWIPIFEGIKDYLNHQCGNAQKNWQRPIPEVYFSPFMKVVFSKQFTSAWLKGHMARCEIESGNYMNIRQGLENGQTGDEAEFNFLTAMTYIKEASEKSPQAAVPYYRIALSYLNKVPVSDSRYTMDRQQIMHEIGQKAQKLIQENSFQELGFYSEILEKGNASDELTQISNTLALELNKEIDANNWKQVEEIVELLSRTIGKGDMRDKLKHRFELLLNKALDSGDFSHVEFYWKTIRAFADDSNQLSDQFADMAAAKILVMIPFDDNKLTATQPYIAFWKTVEKDHSKRLQFADALATVSQQMWNTENQEQKAIAVMQIAYSIPAGSDQKAFYNRLEQMLESLWKRSSEADVIDQYPYFLQAVNQFGFTHVNVLDPKEAAQQLVDAEYMFGNGRYLDAKKRAKWALQVDPRNQKAKRLVGLSDFYFGDYQDALDHLNGMESDPEVEKAIAISQLLTGNSKQGDVLLQQLESQGKLNAKDSLRIGFGLLAINQPQASLKWLEKSTLPNDSIMRSGRMFANFSVKDYQKVIDDYAQLEYPYSSLDGLQGITIESLIALGKIDAAEEMLLNMLKKGVQPDSTEFPLYFQLFKSEKLDAFNRNYMAAKFYSEIKKNPLRAISYHRQIRNPTPENQLSYARDLEANGNVQEAYVVLQSLSQNEDLSPQLKKQVFLDLAKSDQSLRYWIQAAENYQRYLQIVPKDTEQRAEYAKILAKLRRYDLALQQLQESKEKDPLLLIEILIHLGRYEEATKEANAWLQETPELTDQLKLAALFTKVKDSTLPQTILKQIKDPNKLTIDQKEALINYWVDTGEFSKAQEIARANKSLMQKRASGLLALANFASKTTSRDEAIDYAKKAAAIHPKSQEVSHFIAENALPVGPVISDENNPSKQLHNAKALLRYANALLAAKKLSSLHTSLEVQQASNWLSDLSRAYPQLPEVWYYYGVSLLDLRQYVDAEIALNHAISLDPNYAEAFVALAEVYRGQNDLAKAADKARQALNLDPYLTSAWETLGSVHEQQGQLIDAAEEYQRAISYKPNEVPVLIKYGKIRLKASDPEQAIGAFENALVYAPNDINLLKLTIVTYNNTDLRRDRPLKQLKAKQMALYKKLEELDSKEAESIKTDLIK